MRRRFAVLASVLTVVVAVAVPGAASAAPRHNHGLTINATPNPIITGDAVLIYGQLNGADSAGRTIVLYHRINPRPYFTVVGVTKTNSFGFYEFTRAEDVVLTNRSWFVRAPGLPGNVHSRTVHERVAAALSLTASSTTGDTGHPVVFSGHVDPVGFHVGEPVYLQEQDSSGDWHTLKVGLIGGGSNYSISYRFRAPDTYTLRVLFRGDDRNIAAASDSVSVDIDQTQNPTFTINTSDPIISAGQSATISGVLYYPQASATSPLLPEPNIDVTLFGRVLGQSRAVALGTTATGTNGGYSFTVSPQNNTEYFVRTTFAPVRRTASLFEGVQDVVTLTPSSSSSVVGQKVTFTGTVAPDKAGHLIELQRLGKDGDFHTVAIGVINFASAYRFGWRFGNSGSFTFRTRVPSDRQNVSGVSSPVTITVALPPVASLPTTS
ncbi:MAG: hypothetical protein JO181_21315 [Solirubrobacterales bacterium]|nr:hypothetical protein [Solirubrobacterales bacterium]MBV9796701.1 hypothetical protein [Solirubrobacterales bacterium]